MLNALTGPPPSVNKNRQDVAHKESTARPEEIEQTLAAPSGPRFKRSSLEEPCLFAHTDRDLKLENQWDDSFVIGQRADVKWFLEWAPTMIHCNVSGLIGREHGDEKEINC
eukprot:1009656-Amphidinium_carterae.1